MKKLSLIIVFFGVFAANTFAGGIQEYKGKNYLVSILGGHWAVAYATKQDMAEYDLTTAIYENKLNFIGVIAPVNIDEIIRRGYIQNGDKFLLSNDFLNILVQHFLNKRVEKEAEKQYIRKRP